MVITVLSDLVNLRLDALLGNGVELGKVIILFLLLVGLTSSVYRLRILLLLTPLYISVMVLFAVLQFLGYIDLKAFYVNRTVYGKTEYIYGGLIEKRLIGTLGYSDPNDICTLINVAIIFSIYGLSTMRPRWVFGGLWLTLLGLQGYALKLTQSRGGLLGTLAGLGIFFWAQFGIRKGIPVLVLVLPLFLSFLGNRQVDLGSSSGTAQQRVQLWADALATWMHYPIQGVGGGCLNEYTGRPPHNSFLAAYGDLGFFGGTLFLGAFFLAIWQLYQFQTRSGTRLVGPSRPPSRRGVARMASDSNRDLDPGLERMRPFLMGAVGTYAISIASTNHTYTVATYEVLGLVAAYIRIVESTSLASAKKIVFDGYTLGLLCLVSIIFLIFTFIFVQSSVRW